MGSPSLELAGGIPLIHLPSPCLLCTQTYLSKPLSPSVRSTLWIVCRLSSRLGVFKVASSRNRLYEYGKTTTVPLGFATIGTSTPTSPAMNETAASAPSKVSAPNTDTAIA